LNFYMPISKVDENMKIAHKRDAIWKESFFFRKDTTTNSSHDACVQRTMKEIMFGKEGNKCENSFPGLINLVESYLEELPKDIESRKKINAYLRLIKLRVHPGNLLTMAAWQRRFVLKHPEYKHDSIISDVIAYDLIKICDKIAKKEVLAPKLLPRKESEKKSSTLSIPVYKSTCIV